MGQKITEGERVKELRGSGEEGPAKNLQFLLKPPRIKIVVVEKRKKAKQNKTNQKNCQNFLELRLSNQEENN